MSSKTLLSIYLPATQATLEMWVPNDLSVHDATQLICAIVEEREGRWFKPGPSTALYLRSTGEELDINVRIKDYAFVNGSQLVLI